MKYLYVFDDYYQSLRNGIGTFNNQILHDLKQSEYCIVKIELNSDSDIFTILTDDKGHKLRFPSSIQGWSTNNFKNVCIILKLYISDNQNNIFIFNYNNFDKILIELRDLYPLSKIIKVIHDLNWTTSLLGDEFTFRNIISKSNILTNIEHKYIIDSFLLEKNMMSKADIIVCSSPETKQLLKDLYLIKEKKIKLINNGLKKCKSNYITKQKLEIIEKFGFSIGDKILLYVGRVNQVKGFHIALKAFEKILLTYPESRMVICGGISDPDKIFSLSKHITSNLSYLGHVTQDELTSLYHIADVGLLPSYTEQCSYTAIEMMMFGLPIVCSNGNGLRSMFENNVSAIVAEIVKYDDNDIFINNFYEGIKTILENESLARQLGEGASNRYLESYSHKKMINRYLKLFKQFTLC